MLAWLYLGSATLKRFHDEGARADELPFARLACEHAFERAEAALDGVLRNLPTRPAAWLLRALVFPFGRRERGPDDATSGEVARAVLDDADVRERLTADIFLPPADEPGLGRLDAALAEAQAALPVEAKLRRAVRSGRARARARRRARARGARAGLLDDAELELLHAADRARDEAIQVDVFAPEDFPRPGGDDDGSGHLMVRGRPKP